MQTQLLEAIRRTTSDWVLVVGDLMLDRYLFGKVERISPEAPVPVMLIEREVECVGGAANVAANLAGLGLQTHLCGFVGADEDGGRLQRAIRDIKINTQGLVQTENHSTIVKTRVVGGHQQMMRLDRESHAPYAAKDAQALLDNTLHQVSQKPAVVILSDYAKGVLTPQFCQAVIAECRFLGIPVLIDPKGQDFSKYAGATALTPNKREAAEICQVDIRNNAALLSAAAKLRADLNLDFIAVTRGEEGISLICHDTTTHIPAAAKQVFDVSGAGDTVIATLAFGMSAGLSPHDALHLANIAAGVVVGKIGTAPILKAELLATLSQAESQQQADKICSRDQAVIRSQVWQAQGVKVVFTNGCFDLLHAGHVTYLEQARKLGDKLILGLNTDASVRKLKGENRPVIHEADRARVLAALEAIDAVVLFDEDTPLALIKAVKPQILVKGDDYAEADVVGGEEVKSWGGKVALIPVVPGRSSSGIIEKLAS
ncbi:MAG: D-glycero-beta-D-manno-heptose-7-phosphate kinase [Methylophilaceae bacterium]